MGVRKTHCVNGHPRTVAGSKCKFCQRMYRKTWYKNHPGYDRERYSGFDNITFERKLKEQKGKCAICERLMASPHADHDHETGQLRDLLCSSCNLAIGHLQDDPLIAARAYEYLFRWKV
jgi:Recombination endonuclease VII